MRVVSEIMQATSRFSASCMILYGASQSGLPDEDSLSLISQLTTTSVSRRILCGMDGYFSTLPYIDFLSSFMNPVEVFPRGIMPSYLPSSLPDNPLPDLAEGAGRDLTDLITSLKVDGILNSSYRISLTKTAGLINPRPGEALC